MRARDGFYADGTKFARQEGEKGHQGGGGAENYASRISARPSSRGHWQWNAAIIKSDITTAALFPFLCVRVCVWVWSYQVMVSIVLYSCGVAARPQRPLDTLRPTRAEVMH
jgi:hypothetical protein